MAPKFQKGPDLKRFMDKRLKISLNGKRTIIGTLRGYDAFLNIVLEHVEDIHTGQYYGTDIVVRGNSIIQFEAIDRVVVATAAAAGGGGTGTATTDE